MSEPIVHDQRGPTYREPAGRATNTSRRPDHLSTQQSCTNENLFKDRPWVQVIRNQQDTGWCYAFSVADLLSYYVGERVSAVAIAETRIDFIRKLRQPLIGASEMLQNSGLQNLLNAQLPNPRFDYQENGAYTYTMPLDFVLRDGYLSEKQVNDFAFLSFLTKLKRDQRYNDLLIRLGIVPLAEKSQQQLSAKESDNSAITKYLLTAGFTTSQINSLSTMLNAQTTSILTDAISALNLQKKNTPFRRHAFSLERGEFYGLENSFPVIPITPMPGRMLAEAHEALNNRAPFIMTHDVSYFTNSNSPGALHASIVAGRRWNPNKSQCEFLVKNSWGANRSPYNLNRVEPLDGEWSGYYWLSEENFLHGMTNQKTKRPEGEVFWVKFYK